MSDRQSAAEALRRETEAARTLVASLLPILENDDVLRRDMVDGETNLHDAIRQGLARIVEIRALVNGIDATLAVLGDRGKRLEDQGDRIREALFAAMEVAGLKRLETPLGTISLRALPPKVVVIDEKQIPGRFWRLQEPRLDRVLLKGALAAGETVPGAEMGNGGATIHLSLG